MELPLIAHITNGLLLFGVLGSRLYLAFAKQLQSKILTLLTALLTIVQLITGALLAANGAPLSQVCVASVVLLGVALASQLVIKKLAGGYEN